MCFVGSIFKELSIIDIISKAKVEKLYYYN